MISRKEMLDIIATEAIEGGDFGGCSDHRVVVDRPSIPEEISRSNPHPPQSSQTVAVNDDVWLVRMSDGRLEWRD